MSTTNGISSMRAASMPKASGASAPVSPQQKMSNLFQQIDSSGTGRITKAQFEQAFNKLNLPPAVKAIGPDAAFSKLDSSGSGVVSKQDFIHGMEALVTQKAAQPRKEAATEAKPAAAANVNVSLGNVAKPNPPVNMPAPSAGGAIGNTINITA